MKRKVHRAFVEEGLDRQQPTDPIRWFMATCHRTHVVGFSLRGRGDDTEQIQVALGWLNHKCEAEHVL